jgi:hypothetical protein
VDAGGFRADAEFGADLRVGAAGCEQAQHGQLPCGESVECTTISMGRPGGSRPAPGFFVILDFVRPRSPKDAGQAGTLNDLFFALTSASGTWPVEELAEWQRGAGLEPRKPVRMRTSPDAVIQAAVKPR